MVVADFTPCCVPAMLATAAEKPPEALVNLLTPFELAR